MDEFPSIMLIPNDAANHAEKSGAVLRDQLVECFRISGLEIDELAPSPGIAARL